MRMLNDWEQLHCAKDCKSLFGGLCGNLQCDDPLHEAAFCPGDCPPLPPLCPTGADRVMARPMRVFANEWVVLQTGVYHLPTNKDAAPNMPPFLVGAWDAKQQTFYIVDGNWLKRRGSADPCADPQTVESAACIPLPPQLTSKAPVDGISDVEVGADGFVYLAARRDGLVLRRPIAAAQAPWEVVITGLWGPADLWLQGGTAAGDPTRVFVHDGDIWVGVLGGSLPLRRAYP
ncbi:MAG: hypothetical protein FJ100_12975 [Deltaproteobacteria bacterium]|nr:hypothetical protein [Deltaproteobacteria bacterium]